MSSIDWRTYELSNAARDFTSQLPHEHFGDPEGCPAHIIVEPECMRGEGWTSPEVIAIRVRSKRGGWEFRRPMSVSRRNPSARGRYPAYEIEWIKLPSNKQRLIAQLEHATVLVKLFSSDIRMWR